LRRLARNQGLEESLKLSAHRSWRQHTNATFDDKTTNLRRRHFLRLTAAAFFIPQSRARQGQVPKVNQSTHDPFLSLRSQRPVFSQTFYRKEPAPDMV
jgi:hypothetical protein